MIDTGDPDRIEVRNGGGVLIILGLVVLLPGLVMLATVASNREKIPPENMGVIGLLLLLWILLGVVMIGMRRRVVADLRSNAPGSGRFLILRSATRVESRGENR